MRDKLEKDIILCMQRHISTQNQQNIHFSDENLNSRAPVSKLYQLYTIKDIFDYSEGSWKPHPLFGTLYN